MASRVDPAQAVPNSILVGRPGSPGLGVGRSLAVAGAPGSPVGGASPRGRAAAADPAEEVDRLRAALSTAAAELTELAARTTEAAGEEVGAIFEAQALFARDPGIVDPAIAAIGAGSSAEDAILSTTEAHAEQLAAVDDEYFRERAADLRDIGRRVAAIVRGERRPDLWHADGEPAVLLAADLDPSAVAGLRRELVAGIVLAGGAPTGHAAIVARALGIPMVLGVGAALDGVPATATIAVDGTAGTVFVDPGVAALTALRAEHAPPAAARTAGTSSARAHGMVIEANVASALEVEAAVRAGADGIGLVRTELLFLGRTSPPSVGEQRATYRSIMAAAGDRPVVFRTLDIGGDKPADWHDGTTEANPALGVRGIRLGLRTTSLLDDQLTALLEAAAGGPLRVMLPMVSTLEELDDARARVDDLAAALARAGRACATTVLLGIMIEVPAAALMADALARSADFFSIGTNDLVQYTLAADRTSADLADLAVALQPAVLRLIDGVVRAAAAHRRPVSVCGEAAADARVVPVLVGLGIRELSVSPASIGRVRDLVEDLDLERCRDLAVRALAAGSLPDVERIVEEGIGTNGAAASTTD